MPGPRFRFDTSELKRFGERIGRRGPEFMQRVAAMVTGLLEDAKTVIVRRFRTGAPFTTDSRTARRSGALADAYDAVGELKGPTFEGAVGLIRPGTDADVLLYGRVQEGYDATGVRVEQFVITPKHGPYLVFQLPPEHGGAWVSVKRVVLRPRPSLDYVAGRMRVEVPARLNRIWENLLTHGPADQGAHGEP